MIKSSLHFRTALWSMVVSGRDQFSGNLLFRYYVTISLNEKTVHVRVWGWVNGTVCASVWVYVCGCECLCADVSVHVSDEKCEHACECAVCECMYVWICMLVCWCECLRANTCRRACEVWACVEVRVWVCVSLYECACECVCMLVWMCIECVGVSVHEHCVVCACLTEYVNACVCVCVQVSVWVCVWVYRVELCNPKPPWDVESARVLNSVCFQSWEVGPVLIFVRLCVWICKIKLIPIVNHLCEDKMA